MKYLLVLVGLLMLASCGEKNNQDITTAIDKNKQRTYQIKSFSIPNNLTFAGEAVPTNRFDIKESIDKELLINAYWHSHTMLLIKKSNKWFPLIERILQENNIHDDFKYMAVVESNLSNAISPAGAKGFWQFMTSTAKEYNLEVNSSVDERYDVKKSTYAACKYLKRAYKNFNNWTLAAASYNMGMTGLKNKIKQQKVNSYYDLQLNSETSRYIYRLLAVKLILSNPEKYGFFIKKEHLYSEPSLTKTIIVDSTISNLAEFAKKQQTNLKLLKILNPWLIANKLENNNKKNYQIKIYITN